jgi:hypothetical protein
MKQMLSSKRFVAGTNRGRDAVRTSSKAVLRGQSGKSIEERGVYAVSHRTRVYVLTPR